MKERQQNSTAHPILFLMVDSSDHVTGKTGLTVTVTIAKDGGAFGAVSGTVSEIGNGIYAWAGNASDRDTLGELAIHASASGADPFDDKYTIVPWDPFDGNLKLTGLTGLTAPAAGKLPTVGTGANQIAVDGNGNASAKLGNVAHGGAAATLELGGSSSTPPLYIHNSGGDAAQLTSTGGNGHGAILTGAGGGDGFHAIGGATGNGIKGQGGSTSGSGLHVTAQTSGDGITATGAGSGKGISATVDANVTEWKGATAPANTGDAYSVVNNGTYGNNALLTAVQNVQNNTFIATSIPQALEIPDSGSVTVNISIVFSDETGAAKNLDSGNPTIALVNDAGTDVSSRLGVWTNPATGKYVIPYTSSSSDALEGLHWDVSGTINSKLRRMVAYTQIVNTTAVDFTSSDRTNLSACAAALGTAGSGLTNIGDARVAHLDADVSSRAAPGSAMTLSGDFTSTMKTSLNNATPAVTVSDKTGFKLASDGLDAVSTTAPSGVAANFREMVVQTWRRLFKKATQTSSQLKTYADDNTTVLTTQALSDDGTVQTQGVAS